MEIEGSDKKLCIVNSHMSAYDEGGTIRKTQIEELRSFLDERSAAGDYIVVGGDWNHDLLTNNPGFSYDRTNRPFGMTKKDPDWLSYFFDENGVPVIGDYTVVASDNAPTCRNNDIPYDPQNSFVCTVDGFIVSKNVSVSSCRTVVTGKGNEGIDGFAFSDHEPVLLEFVLS